MQLSGTKRRACAAYAEKDHIIYTFNGDDAHQEEPEEKEFRCVYQKLNLERLSPLGDMCAETFLSNLLRHRGYSYQKSPALASPFKRAIKQHEIQSYSKDLLTAISANNIPFLKDLCDKQKHILACNRFGESTLHIAARKAFPQIVQLIMKSELKSESPLTIDDYGRSPLSDALWAITPCFSIIEQLLDYSIDLLYLTDVRGCTPLGYLREEHVCKLCLFFYSRRDKYWPLRVQTQVQTQVQTETEVQTQTQSQKQAQSQTQVQVQTQTQVQVQVQTQTQSQTQAFAQEVQVQAQAQYAAQPPVTEDTASIVAAAGACSHHQCGDVTVARGGA